MIFVLFLKLGFSQLAEPSPCRGAGSDRVKANQALGEKSEVERCVFRLPGFLIKPGPRQNFAL